MKLFNSIFAAAIIAAGITTTAHAEVRLGLDSSNYEPFYSRSSDGEWTGWEIEIGDAICAAMELSLIHI